MKLIKLSIAATLAVSCISAANAKSLTEAIKNVDISGTVAYRYNDYEAGTTTNNYKVAANLKSKVNDDITFNSRVIIGQDNANAVNSATNSGAPVSLETNAADQNAGFALSEANFAYTGIQNLTITAGKQGIATPFTRARDSIGGESTGTGILAIYSTSPVTLAGGYFNQTNIKVEGATALNGANIYTVGLMGSFAGINANAWYIDIQDTANAYTLGLSGNYKVGSLKLSPAVRYSEQDEDANSDEISTFKAEVSAKMGIVDAYVGYGQTGKNGGVALDGYSTDTILDPHWTVTLWNQADADALYVGAGVQATDKLHVSLKYSDLDVAAGNTGDRKETYAQAVYQMSSNFFTYVRAGEAKADNGKTTNIGRLHVQYNF